MRKFLFALSTTALLSSFIISPASASSSYIVKKGDTLSKIAKKQHTTVQQLKKINKLKSDKIHTNQKLIISTATVKQAGQATSISMDRTQTATYIAVPGDTLTKIANKHHLTVAKLKELNPKLAKTDKVYVGQTLVVSKTTNNMVIDLPTSSKEKTKAQVESTHSFGTYIVVKGDTLSKIAKQTNTTIAELKALNHIKSNTILVGQKLKIGKPTNGTVSTTAFEGSSNNSQINKVISEAKKVMGTPYVWAGVTPEGFDCSGLVYYSFKQAGYNITRQTAASYYYQGKKVSTPKSGDLVFFATSSSKTAVTHMGIYLGDNQFIHSSTSDGVTISTVTSPYYKSRLIGYKSLAF